MITEKEELNLKMSIDITHRESAAKYNLPIDDDTAFTIYFDVYKYDEDKEYLYFKMEENTAVAPFFYDVSYVKDELIKIHQIFKSVDIDQAKEHLEMLFNNKKVKLHYANEERTEIIMEIEAIWFIEKIKIKFELRKEMIREEEKDKYLIQLYTINKNKKKKAKLFNAYLKQNEGAYRNIINELLANFDLDENANNNNNANNANNNTNTGNDDNDNRNDDSRNDDSRNYERELSRENSESLYNSNANENNNEREEIIIENNNNNNDKEFIEQMKNTFKKKKVNAHKCEIGYKADITLKNRSKKPWSIGSIKFKIDKEKSNPMLNDENIIYPDYELASKQDGDFSFIFDENTPIGEYDCFFDVYIDGKKLEGIQYELYGKIKES